MADTKELHQTKWSLKTLYPALKWLKTRLEELFNQKYCSISYVQGNSSQFEQTMPISRFF
jgi:hypothetical protein